MAGIINSVSYWVHNARVAATACLKWGLIEGYLILLQARGLTGQV